MAQYLLVENFLQFTGGQKSPKQLLMMELTGLAELQAREIFQEVMQAQQDRFQELQKATQLLNLQLGLFITP